MYNVPPATQQTQDICITFIQRRPNVFDVGPTLHEVIQMFTECQYKLLGSSSFQIHAVIQSVCLQASDQVGVRAKCFELLTHVAQVYMNLLWFENLLLMRLWVWNAYLVLLWNRALAYPRALLPSGGPLSREFWQLTTPLSRFFSQAVEHHEGGGWARNLTYLDSRCQLNCFTGYNHWSAFSQPCINVWCQLYSEWWRV